MWFENALKMCSNIIINSCNTQGRIKLKIRTIFSTKNHLSIEMAELNSRNVLFIGTLGIVFLMEMMPFLLHTFVSITGILNECISSDGKKLNKCTAVSL